VRRLFYAAAAVLFLALAYHVGSKGAEGKATTNLLGMTDNPRIPSSAVAIDQAGVIYFGQSAHWSRVGATPSAPAFLWTRNSTGEIFIALTNGDLYRLEPNWSLTYDSNVFSSQ
jgi:secreted PhoX family phosphatase